MIIFDLDGTLANCEHRRHFVDSSIPHPTREEAEEFMRNGCKWEPNWPAFYEACNLDEPIESVIEMYQSLMFENHIRLGKEVQIWSGRCESVRAKTELWLDLHVWGSPECILKMRPIGDNTPDEVLKERWLDEAIAEGKAIDFVFDDRPKVVRMWRRRGVFVFDCNQTGMEF